MQLHFRPWAELASGLDPKNENFIRQTSRLGFKNAEEAQPNFSFFGSDSGSDAMALS